MSWLTHEADALVLRLRVQPRGGRNAVIGTQGDCLRVRIAAPPVDGAANAGLLRWLAEEFDVPLRQVELLTGATSRIKRVRIKAPRRTPPWLAAYP